MAPIINPKLNSDYAHNFCHHFIGSVFRISNDSNMYFYYSSLLILKATTAAGGTPIPSGSQSSAPLSRNVTDFSTFSEHLLKLILCFVNKFQIHFESILYFLKYLNLFKIYIYIYLDLI